MKLLVQGPLLWSHSAANIAELAFATCSCIEISVTGNAATTMLQLLRIFRYVK